MRAEIPLTPFFFDCLYAEGESLVDMSHESRGARLNIVAPGLWPCRSCCVPHPSARSNSSTRRCDTGMKASWSRRWALVTPQAGVASSGSRSRSPARSTWSGLAAEWGHGRRTGWLSNLHLGARDPEHGGFIMLGKTFKGLTDEMLAWQTDKLRWLEISHDRHTVFVRPELVVEIAFNEVQESAQYPGGLALRFARVKGYRQDKSAADADTIDTVRDIYLRLVAPPSHGRA